MQQVTRYSEIFQKLITKHAALLKRHRKWLYKKTIVKPYSFLHKYALAFIPFKAPSKITIAPAINQHDYIIWGVIDWHFRHQRPQQLAKVLANTGRRVFYISSNFKNDKRSGFDVEPLDESGRLFQIKLYVNNPPVIYFTKPNDETVRQLQASIGSLLYWANAKKSVSLVQHPFWCDIAKAIPNSKLVYDCIDHHDGFGNNSNDVLALEYQLFQDADVTITTSAWLDNLASKYTQRRTLIRNACDYNHFAIKPSAVYRDSKNRKIIGYYGAIANWFDVDLILAVAEKFTDCCILLIGADTIKAQQKLHHLHNVVFIGEVPYSNLPYYLYAFDVALLPFKVIPLTLATNPVKVYEYLSAGKSVVSVNLPEIHEFNNLIKVANNTTQFLLEIFNALNTENSLSDVSARKAFARDQTWAHRANTLVTHAESSINDPVISVIVITYNNLEFTHDCLDSIEKYSDYDNMEVVVVDNGSSDGSAGFLKEWCEAEPNRKLILNDTNRGFAAANNQGLAAANGEYLVMLNNDTYVTPGWIRTLYHHLKYDNSIGIIGPVTNNIGNEAKIDIYYKDMDDMLKLSNRYTHEHLGQIFQLSTAAFFCVMLPRKVYELVGQLDEAFGLGFFEDDDYCRRIEQAGLKIICAQDVFIHHQLSASFMKLDREIRRTLFNENKKIYEQKWGHWTPHKNR